jgi:hypothetical protein
MADDDEGATEPVVPPDLEGKAVADELPADDSNEDEPGTFEGPLDDGLD